MKQAELKAEEKEIEEKETKLKDLSEWKTSSSEELKQKANAKPKIISVGYTSINNLSNGPPIVGRRTFGVTKEDKVEKKDEENDIDSLWKKQKDDKKGLKGMNRSEKRGIDESPKKSQNKKRKSHPPN